MSGITLLISKFADTKNSVEKAQHQDDESRHRNNRSFRCKDFGKIILVNSLEAVPFKF
jgi:hypothetical protein